RRPLNSGAPITRGARTNFSIAAGPISAAGNGTTSNASATVGSDGSETPPACSVSLDHPTDTTWLPRAGPTQFAAGTPAPARSDSRFPGTAARSTALPIIRTEHALPPAPATRPSGSGTPEQGRQCAPGEPMRASEESRLAPMDDSLLHAATTAWCNSGTPK